MRHAFVCVLISEMHELLLIFSTLFICFSQHNITGRGVGRRGVHLNFANELNSLRYADYNRVFIQFTLVQTLILKFKRSSKNILIAFPSLILSSSQNKHLLSKTYFLLSVKSKIANVFLSEDFQFHDA